jgi:hypothetical protein
MTDRETYRKQGFLLLRNFFEKEDILRLHAEAKEVFISQIKRHNPNTPDLTIERNFEDSLYDLFEKDFETVVNCGKQVQHLVLLHRLGTEPRVIEALSALGLSFPVISVRPVMYFNNRRLAKKEDYWRLGAHQDWRSSQGSLDAITIWMPMVEVDKSLGALEVIPRSHKWGLLESEKVSYYGKISETLPESEFVPVEAAPGDALFFSSFLVHRSGTNTTDSIRWSCHLRYNNFAEQTFIGRGYPHAFTYKPQENLITPAFPSRDLLREMFE